MSVIKFNRNFSTLFNWDTDSNPTTEQDYQSAVKNWTETEMNLVDTLLWQPTTEYDEGNIAKTPSLPSQYVLVCTTAGISGSTEPDYTNVQLGDSVTDGSVTWNVSRLAIDVVPIADRAMANASNIGANAEIDNSELWGSAIGGGAVAEDDGKLVTGGTVYAVTSELASDIADNTNDIATNIANISQNATDIDIADKRIINIEKLLQGNLYDYQTDSTEAYTKTVPSGAMPYAGLEKVGGKTVVWNQLVKNGNFADGTTGWSCTSTGSITATDNVMTYTISTPSSSAFIQGNVLGTKQSHKYFVHIEAKYNTAATQNTVSIYIGSGGYDGYSTYVSISEYNQWKNLSGIFTRSSTSGDDKLTVYPHTEKMSASETIEYRNVWYVDLTLLYGEGNEPTAEQFEALFPALFYPYSVPTLISSGVTEVVSKDANNATLQTYSIPAEVQALEGYGWSAGSVYNEIDFERKVFIKRVGRKIYDGTETWEMESTYNFFSASGRGGGDRIGSEKMVCSYCVCDASISAISTDTSKFPVCFISAAGNFNMLRADITHTGADMKAWCLAQYNAGTPLTVYYELAIPVEIDISEYLTDDNLIQVESGGTLTFPNQNGTDYQIPVPSEEEYMIDLQEAINNG